VLTPALLARCGRDLAAPFVLRLGEEANARSLRCEAVLRWLPGRRAVLRVRDERLGVVVAKVYLRDAATAMDAERTGLAALAGAGFAVPALLDASLFEGPGRAEACGVQCLQLLAPARSLAECWPQLADEARVAHLRELGGGLARLHAAGARAVDPHLGNFLLHEGSLFALDGGGIASGRGTVAVHAQCADLALLHAQLPPDDDVWADATLAAYAQASASTSAGAAPDLSMLRAAIARARALRVRIILRKSMRDCSEFAVAQDARQFSTCRRDRAATLRDVLADPDAAISAGVVLKAGNTATVARIDAGDGLRVVCKRYNIKGLLHRVSRAWRPTRAEHSWCAAQRLAALGIATAEALALRVERIGPLRGRAFLFLRDVPGPTLAALTDEARTAGSTLAPELQARVALLLVRLHAAGCVHGDLKASNLLLEEGAPVLVDLDALVHLPAGARRDRLQARERARFLANWPAGAERDGWTAALAAAAAGWAARGSA
jgi:tRNA A-37 threonylcarbamoyl transferase component Bud32